MTHGSLFSGIGGFDLAAEWMGWENLFHCEWNLFGQKVLHHYWPEAEQFTDITKSDFTKYANRIDILTGGFPCQPYSLAGKRKGKEDERHLWPHMCRAIKEIQPRWVVGENVFGLVNWDAGLVFHEVQADLETEGYEVFPYVLPAAGINAPHRRDRVWFVAYRSDKRCNNGSDNREERHIQATGEWKLSENKSERNGREFGVSQNGSIGTGVDSNPNSNGQHWCNSEHEVNAGERRFDAQRNFEQVGVNAADSSSESSRRKLQQRQGEREFGRYDCEIEQRNASDTTCRLDTREKYRQEKTGQHTETNQGSWWADFPTQSPICGRNDGLPTELDGITFSKWRNESVKAYGNAIVPQVALQIFKAIEQYESATMLQK